VVENTPFVGLDVHKKTISVALVEDAAGAAVRFYGTIENTPDAIRNLCKKLSKVGQRLHCCYEAGPCGGQQRPPNLAVEIRPAGPQVRPMSLPGRW
jgi:transposase